MQILMNGWVIGIGGGIISGLIVTFVTRYLFARRDRKEYQQKIATANNEIIYALRPSIAEKVFPSSEVIRALSMATANKYGVNANDLSTPNVLADFFIKEIMDNSFLSSEQKAAFCELVLTLREPVPDSTEVPAPEAIITKRAEWLDSSIILGLTTALMSTVFAFYLFRTESHSESPFEIYRESTLSRYLPFFAISIAVPLIVSLVAMTWRRLREIRQIEPSRVSSKLLFPEKLDGHNKDPKDVETERREPRMKGEG